MNRVSIAGLALKMIHNLYSSPLGVIDYFYFLKNCVQKITKIKICLNCLSLLKTTNKKFLEDQKEQVIQGQCSFIV